jgi:hypothetical protein
MRPRHRLITTTILCGLVEVDAAGLLRAFDIHHRSFRYVKG